MSLTRLFFNESEFVNHKNLIHNVDLGVEDKPPAYKPYLVALQAYLPVLNYFDPETGRGFYSEPEFVNWMKNH